MKTNLCRCNNCYTIMIDQNPQINAPKFEIPKQAVEMEQISDCFSGVFLGCPVCHADDYLIDIYSLEMLEETIKKQTK